MQLKKSQLRVAQFTDNYGPGSNGLTVAEQNLEGNLLDINQEVIVIAPKANGPNPHLGRPGRTEIRLPSVTVPKMPTKVAYVRGFKRAIKKISDLKPNVLHVHGLGPVGVLGVWTALELKIPLLITWHTDFEAYAKHYSAALPFCAQAVRIFASSYGKAVFNRQEIKESLTQFSEHPRSEAILLGLCAKMLRTADLVTVPSPKTADRVKRLYPDCHIRVVPNGVDPLPISTAPIKINRGPGPLALYVGRIAPEKGLLLLADAFEIARQKCPDMQLLIVGDYSRYPKIRQKLEHLRDHGNVILAGEHPRDKIGAFYNMADFFVYPSLTETQALVLHEAALAKLPIVSVDAELQLVVKPGINGEITNPTPSAMATGILNMLSKIKDPQWLANAKKTSADLASQWSIKSQAEEMLNIYAELATKTAE